VPTDVSDFQSLCTVIGFVEVTWALFEQSLDCIVLNTHRDLGASAIEKRLPKNYAAKSAFLKKAFANVIVLNPLKSEAYALLDKSDVVAKKRNDLTHGVLTRVEMKDGVYSFSKIDYVGFDHSYRDFSFDPNDFPILAEELMDLGIEVTRLGLKVNKLNN
jgi:hypothetical protein